MTETHWIVDILLVILLVSYLVYGYRVGILRTLFGIAGLVLGGIAAYFVVPLAATAVPPEWRVLTVIVVALLLLSLGFTVGATIGRVLRRGVQIVKLGFVDRLLGAVANVVVAALMLGLIASQVSALGVPALTQMTASSAVIKAIDGLTPDPVKTWLAQVRTAAVDDALPWITEALGVPSETPAVPDVATDSASLAASADSVVRISGTAAECGLGLTGSGFVVSDDRVVTNAHVLAGVTDPVIEAPNELPRPGRVVYFDPVDDLAVIAVDDLDARPIPLGQNLAAGADAVVDGYPHGGPFTTGPAGVLSVSSLRVPDIRNESSSDRSVYTLAANVQPGNSGGPLLATDGTVVGVVFARATTVQNVGYAMTLAELSPVAAQAASLDAPVSSGGCIRE